jgi:hypothetical protein
MPIRRQPTDEEIAARAHELYEQQGRADGRAMDHWLQAKSELEAAEASAETDDVQESAEEPKAPPSKAKPRRR